MKLEGSGGSLVEGIGAIKVGVVHKTFSVNRTAAGNLSRHSSSSLFNQRTYYSFVLRVLSLYRYYSIILQGSMAQLHKATE